MENNLGSHIESKRPIVWTIAGSDSGGGAGIQADLQTINDLSAHACTVITAITAQSSVAVDLVEAVSNDMLQQQLDTLAKDLPPVAIKIGLLANQQQVNFLAERLTRFNQHSEHSVPVVLDPVLVATCGDQLNTDAIINFVPFKGLISLITPNYEELITLTSNLQSPTTIERAEWLSQELNCSVLAKGGDQPLSTSDNVKHSKDILICRNVKFCSELHENETITLVNTRIDTKNTHGTGCTLSSAITSFLAHGYPLQDSVIQANAYVHKGIKQSFKVGSGAGPIAKTGWPDELEDFPQIQCKHSAISSFENHSTFKKLKHEIGVYPVVETTELIETLLKAKCKTIQLRIKDNLVKQYGKAWLEQQIKQAIRLGEEYDAQVFINDHWQLAIKHNAFGVHLGQEDIFTSNISKLKASGLALGLSSHGVFEALIAQQIKPSYIAIGHIYPTTTKDMPSNPQGIIKAQHQVQLLKQHVPLVAIGGINHARFNEVKSTGIDGVAVVRAVTESKVPFDAYNQLSQYWQEAI